MKKILRRLAAALTTAALLVGLTGWTMAVELPILMYHDLTEDEAATNSMTVTVERFRLDMEFLQQSGYTPLLPADLIEIQNGRQAMPDRPVMITFDDGYRSNYDYAYPVLQQTGMRAAIAVIAYNILPAYSDDAGRHTLTWSELREMHESGVFEIGSHTYNLHNPQYKGMTSPDGIDGVQRRRGESFSAYNARAGGDLRTSLELIRAHTGQTQVNYFSYPFGASDTWMEQILTSEQISVSTVTNPGHADVAKGLRGLPRYGITMERPVSELLRQTDSAVPALARVRLNGTEANLIAYNIGGNNYVRVRDVALLLQNTASGFDVQWNNAARRVELTSYRFYTPNGTENAPLPAGTRTVRSLTEPTVADGVTSMIAAYNIDGYTYYKLRSLGDLCGFAVDWEAATQTVVVTS